LFEVIRTLAEPWLHVGQTRVGPQFNPVCIHVRTLVEPRLNLGLT
jgi:hypothetical protein